MEQRFGGRKITALVSSYWEARISGKATRVMSSRPFTESPVVRRNEKLSAPTKYPSIVAAMVHRLRRVERAAAASSVAW